MEGTYDLDGDGLKEFASIELVISDLEIYQLLDIEIEQNGYQKCYRNCSL